MTGLAFDPPRLSVPPAFDAVPVDHDGDPFVTAVGAAQSGAEPGTLYWAPRPDRADCAVVLGPETVLRKALCVTYVAMNAIGDALGAAMPAGIPLVFGWPDRIVVNGGEVGGVRLAWPEETPADSAPAWMVAGVQVWVTLDVGVAADIAQRTSLRAEGCDEITAREILEGFSRHFVYWINRWIDEGFDRVKTAWLARAANYGPNSNMELRHPWAERELLALNEGGDIVYVENGAKHTGHLREALAEPTWRVASQG